MFGKKQKQSNHTIDDIVSVVILEQTQLYKKRNNWGLSFGSTLGDGRSIVMGETVPDGAEIKFSVTYKDGKKEILTEHSGTKRCTRLLQLAIDPPSIQSDEMTNQDSMHPLFELKKNQLPQGAYTIGDDIPIGIYDFTWVFGSGSLNVWKGSTDTNTLGANLFFAWIGNTQEYEQRQCLHVSLNDGNVVTIQGNLVVEIAKSKKVEIDL